MPAITTEEKLEFILTVLSTCQDLKPNYHEVASLTGCKNANKAQIKFKKIVDDTGKFKLANGKITALEEDEDEDEDA